MPDYQDVEAKDLQDDKLARELARAEEKALAAEERARGPPPKRPWTGYRACRWILPVIVIVLGVIALIFALQESEEEKASHTTPPTETFWEQEDPWEGIRQSDIARWNNGGTKGLTLDVVDALQNGSPWEKIFHTVLKDYEEGEPKSLVFKTEKAAAGNNEGPDCAPVDNKWKICNKNYGATKWRGVTLHIVQDGFIVAATSELNDHYLRRATPAEQRYTLCHELGHALGLGHTDEDYYNVDLGNCMDYTTNWIVSQQPNQQNFVTLGEFYGTVPAETFSLRRQRRHLLQETAIPRNSISIPDSIRIKLQDVTPQLLSSSSSSEEGNSGRRMLRQSDNRQAEHDEISLGDGWSVRVHKLLVV